MDERTRIELENTEKELRNLLISLKEDKLFDNASVHESFTYNREEFWSQMPLLIQCCSKECTSFCLSFSKPPLPEYQSAKVLTEKLANSVLTVASLFTLVPCTEGRRFFKYLQSAVVSIVESAADLVKVTLCGPESAKQQLRNTGTLWEACDKALKLPKDNREAVLLQLDETLAMVKDAFNELQQAGTSNVGDEDEHSLSESEKLMQSPSINLIKVAIAALSKIKSSIQNCTDVSSTTFVDLDKVADGFDQVSPRVDDLASCFFAPCSPQTVDLQAQQLRDCLLALLETYKSSMCFVSSDVDRVEFLRTAANHNLNKLQEITKNALNILAS